MLLGVRTSKASRSDFEPEGTVGGTGTFRQDVEQFLNTLLKNADLASEDGCKEVSKVCGIHMPDTHPWVALAINSVMESNLKI